MKKFVFFYLLFISSLCFSQTLLETINLPAGNFWNGAYGMVFNDSKYWISSSWNSGGVADGIFYALNNNGLLVDTVEIDLPWIGESQGLAFDGTDFWYVERKTARSDLYKVTTTGIVIDSIPIAELFGASNIYLGGAAWDGDGLWISVYSPDARAALYKINVAARAIVDTISVIGLQPEGITVKGDTLFYVMDGFQGDDENIYAIDLNTKNMLFSFHVPEPPGIRQNPRGLAWDGTYFWLLAEPVGASSGRQLFKYDLGGGGTPGITLPFSTINFPNTTIGNTNNYNLTIYSTGTATLTIDSITVPGNIFSYNSLSFPINIPAGGSQDVTVNFTPATYSYYQGLMKIYCNDPVKPVNDVNLRGQGVLSGARIGLSATSYDFGVVWVGEEGIAFWKFNVFNMGDQTLQISDLQFNLPEYTYDAPATPFQIFSTDTLQLTAYFYPTQVGSYIDTLKIPNNDVTNPTAKISMQGTGVFNNYNYGYSFWQYQVPPHPNSSSASPRIEGLKSINDITGDGIPEVIISTENYWTMCLDGAASGSSFPLWIFTTYITNYNAGSIGANFEYGVQDAIQIANDLNGDGFNDVVIAIGGGNEHIYALNGTNGQIIWQYGDEINYDLGDFEAVDVQRDFNGDNVEDVLAIADGNDQGTGYKRAYLFNGTNGNIIWEHYYPGPNPAFGKTIISIEDLNGDNLPDVVIAYGNNGTSDLAVRALNGTNGQTLWTRPMLLYEPKELLELPLPGGGSDIIAGEYFNRIHRLRGGDGTIIWTYQLGGSAGVIQMSLINDINNDQIPDVLIASFASNGLNCLSGATGALLWSWQMDYQFGVASIPDITNDGSDDVIAAARYGNFYCINGKGDSLIFMHSFPGDWMYSVNSMSSIDGNFSNELLAGTRDGKVVCFSGGTVAVPVEFTTFSAFAANNNVTLNWSTATETNNSGFEIERTSSDQESWQKMGFVAGSGTSTEFRSYSFIDENVSVGNYSYRLKQIDFSGQFEYSDIIEIEVTSPNEYSLEQNYPNPFNPTTTISYSIKEKGLVTLRIFDVLGNEVKTLVNEDQEVGVYRLEFNASFFASGIYFYSLKAGDFVSTKKMILLK
ncbi:MAG: choice-of-anchor D domain-containing protein [Ignavibacteriaceae bacterium]|nr:choice-of-anchor D domain-containing protein [Ignavibacteriaceae bacterium]